MTEQNTPDPTLDFLRRDLKEFTVMVDEAKPTPEAFKVLGQRLRKMADDFCGVLGGVAAASARADGDELLPCPFCGGEADYYPSNEAVFKVSWVGHIVHCKTCQGRVQTTIGEKTAKEMWNNRRVPTRDGAEGADDQDPPMKWLIDSLRNLARDLLADPKTPWIGERDPKQHICWTAADRLETAPPKPAPDAMREALKTARPHIGDWLDSLSRAKLLEQVDAALSAPDGAGELRTALEKVRLEMVLAISFLGRDAGSDRLQKTITALIERFHKADDAICAILGRLSPAVAAEPVTWRAFDTTGTVLTRSCNVFTITCEDGHTANRVADHLRNASPPVRGDREAAIRAALKAHGYNDCHIDDPVFINETFRKNIEITIDAILAFPGEREALPLKVLLNGRDDFIVSKGLWSEFTDSLSRQAPHSGR